MKRHKSLYPLSHDHHHVLVEAKNLRAASAVSDTLSLHQVASHFIAYWDNNLQAHFRQEEVILLPVFSRYSTQNDVEIIETLKQHDEIRQGVEELKKNLERLAVLASTSRKLAALLSWHTRYEEQHLFPAIQTIVPEDALWEINRRLSEK